MVAQLLLSDLVMDLGRDSLALLSQSVRLLLNVGSVPLLERFYEVTILQPTEGTHSVLSSCGRRCICPQLTLFESDFIVKAVSWHPCSEVEDSSINDGIQFGL